MRYRVIRGKFNLVSSGTGRRAGCAWTGLWAVLFAVCWISGLAASALSENSADHFQFTRIDKWLDIEDFFVADLDGDGQQDLFRLNIDHRTYHAMPFSRERFVGPAMYQGNSEYRITYAGPLDIDTLKGTEVVVAQMDLSGDSAWMEIHAGFDKSLVLCRTQAIIGKNISVKNSHVYPGWDGHFDRCYTSDLDDDGSPEIIASLTVAFDLYPRGVYVFAYPSGRLKWWFPLAGNPLELTIADANKDGFKEIYFKTWACANGAVVEDRTDGQAYAFCLDHLGYVLWRQELGDRFDFSTGNVLVCDCDKDDTTEIYYTILLRQDEFDRQVRVLEKHRAIDNLFLRQRSFDAAQEFREIYALEYDGQKKCELLVDGAPSIVEASNLSVFRQSSFRQANVAAIADLHQAGGDIHEIILRSQDSIYIIDTGLTLRGAMGAEVGRHFGRIRYFTSPFGRHYLGVIGVMDHTGSTNELTIYEIQTARVEKFPFFVAFLDDYWPGFTIGVLLGILIGYYILRRQSPEKRARKPETAQYSSLLTSLVNFNHGRMAGKNLNRLVFLFSNLPEAPNKLNEIKPNLKAAVEAFQSFTSSQLQSIIDNAQRIRPIKSDINRLEKQIRRLSALMMDLNITELVPGQAPELRKAIPDIITNVQSDIGRVREYLQTHFSANLLRSITGVLAAAAGQFQEQGVGFTKITVRGKTSQSIFFDESELAAVFEELLSNACDAMSESEKKELTLDVTYENSEVVIRLSDTGHGLQAEDPDQIFNRDYSTRGPDRGYGLFQARQQVEHFGGTIRYYNNENSPGATVELVLRTVNHG